MASFEPKPFGKYFLIERIAMGGMAEIYKAKTFGVDGFEKLLAIKKILPHYSADKEFISMLTDEAKLVVRLSHTNIVQIYDLGKIGDDYYISMEHIDGVNLREVISRGKEFDEKIPLPLCLYIASEICKGLDYAHSKRDDHGHPLGIVHRDISPQNILISFEGESKIVDFGIAKAAMNISTTSAGMLKGKITYMSPEQALGKPVDARTDIFSTGLLLYEMITGERFFSGETQLEVLKKIRSTMITEDTLGDKVPQEVRKVLAKALAYNLKDRFETAGDFQIALTKILYSGYSDFSPKQLSQLIQSWFGRELKKRKQKAMEAGATIDSHTRSVLLDAANQPNIVVEKEESQAQKILQDTTKPEDSLTPSQFIQPQDFPNLAPPRPLRNRKRRFLPQVRTSWLMGSFLTLILLVGMGLGFYFKLKAPSGPPIQPETGILKIITTPPGATVYIDNEDWQEKTPTLLENISRQISYEIRLEKEGYQPYTQQVLLGGASKKTLILTLLPVISLPPLPDLKDIFTEVQVGSKPDGASVLINGQESEMKTPAVIERLEVGKKYQIDVMKEGYLTTSKNFVAEKGKNLIFNLELSPIPPEPEKKPEEAAPKPIEQQKPVVQKPVEPVVKREGSLSVTSNVSQASIFVGKEKKGFAPLKMTLTAGSFQVIVKKEGYEPFQQWVTIQPGKTTGINATLRKKEPQDATVVKVADKGPAGTIRVDSTPRGASVLIDGRKAGITPVVIPGLSRNTDHILTLTLPGYNKWVKTIQLKQGRLEITAPLKKN